MWGECWVAAGGHGLDLQPGQHCCSSSRAGALWEHDSSSWGGDSTVPPTYFTLNTAKG